MGSVKNISIIIYLLKFLDKKSVFMCIHLRGGGGGSIRFIFNTAYDMRKKGERRKQDQGNQYQSLRFKNLILRTSLCLLTFQFW